MISTQKKLLLVALPVLAILVVVAATLYVFHPNSSRAVSHTPSPTANTQTAISTALPIPPSVFVSTSDNKIDALMGYQGDVAWEKTLPLSPDAEPQPFINFATHGNLVYVNSLEMSPGLVAYDRDTGNIAWTFDSGYPCYYQGAQPRPYYFLQDKDNIYVITGTDHTKQDCQFSDLTVQVLDAQSGQVRWKYEGFSLIGTKGAYFFLFNDHTLKAVNATDGSQVWSLNIDTYYSLATFSDQFVYLSGDGGAIAVAIASGAISWQYTANTVIFETELDGAAYILAVQHQQLSQFIKLVNGIVQWEIPGSLEQQSVDSYLTVVNGHLLRTTLDSFGKNGWNFLNSEIDPATGETLWQNHLGDGGHFTTVDIIGSGLVMYLASQGGDDAEKTISALSLKTSEPVWSQTLMGYVVHTTYSNGYLIVSTYDHLETTSTPNPGYSTDPYQKAAIGPYYVYLIHASDGKIVWQHQSNTLDSTLFLGE